MPIRTALVALPLLLLLSTGPRESSASAREASSPRPAAALVAPVDQNADSDGGLSPFGVAALVGVGLIPAFVLISRRRQRQQQPN